ncbi:IS1634 family transposase [Ruegeria sp.]|uniref:IS1634 family transposase n=1 Tax=Ruegeria sp. TaxID=1879320 RepID=UPI003AFF9E11
MAHNDSEIEDIKRLAGRLMEQLRIDRSPQMELFTPTEYADLQALVRRAPRPDKLGVDLAECREEARVSLGLRDVMGTMYDQLGWGALLGAARKSANRIVKELVMARIAQPESKRATVEALENQAGITLNLDVVYRSMDYINTPVIDGICKTSHAAAEKLLGGPVTVLFYDCTTLAFDTEREDPAEDADGVEQDHLLAKGFSKDGKHHRAQVMLALIVTSDGLPVGYELFPGNTWEGHTLEAALKALEGRFDVARVTFVADAAMLSKDNQQMLQNKGLPYILGYRMKSAPAAVKANILSPEGRQPWAGHGSEEATEKGWYKVIDQEGARVIVTWSPTRARNDAHKRDKAIEKLHKKLKRSRKPGSFSSRGYGRFLAFPDSGDVTLDDAKIKAAAQWDGLHAIVVHGADELEAQDVIARYHQLWGDRSLLPHQQARSENPAHLSLVAASGPGPYRHLLHGLLLPAAPAQASGPARTPDEPGSYPQRV